MQIVSNTKEFMFKDTAITLGKFDGIHRGHQLLIEEIVKEKKSGMYAVLFTFDTSPYEVVNGKKMTYILDSEEKYALCKNLGIDVVIEYPFDNDTMNMSADDFIQKILINQLGAKKIVVGNDFSFGKGRKGNVDLLKQYAGDYELVVKDKLFFEDTEISSTYIRKCINSGKMEKVEKMLNRPFSFLGKITAGKQIGRTIGIPTINIIPSKDKIIPPNGVYASMAVIEGKKHKGITNVGVNPTVSSEKSIKVETNLLEYCENLYGKKVEVYLLEYIRQEIKFNNIEELKTQIDKDIEIAKNILTDREFS